MKNKIESFSFIVEFFSVHTSDDYQFLITLINIINIGETSFRVDNHYLKIFWKEVQSVYFQCLKELFKYNEKMNDQQIKDFVHEYVIIRVIFFISK